MGFPFNLFSIDWAAHQDALGNDATLVPQWLASLADQLPVVRQEGLEQLEHHLVSAGALAPIAPFVVGPLIKLIDAERAKGRALAASLLANLALCACTRPGPAATELLAQLEEERDSLETITTRHGASTPFGAAVRALLAVIVGRACSPQLTEQLATVQALVLEADGTDEAPPPTVAETRIWLEQVKDGEGHALGLAQRAFGVDPEVALAILEADRRPGTTSVQRVHRAVLELLCRDALGQPASIGAGPSSWERPAQALLLDAAERCCVRTPKVAAALLELITDSSHAVRRRAVEVRVRHAAGELERAWELADALAADWLLPAQAGGVNQSLGRAELLGLLALFAPGRGAGRVAELKAAPAPELALPEGELI